jgi:hypothetical protein
MNPQEAENDTEERRPEHMPALAATVDEQTRDQASVFSTCTPSYIHRPEVLSVHSLFVSSAPCVVIPKFNGKLQQLIEFNEINKKAFTSLPGS